VIATLTARDRVLAALRRQRQRPIPVGAVTQTATVEQMEQLGIRWPEAHLDAELLAGLALGAWEILGFDMVRVPFDQTIEAQLLGAEVDLGCCTSSPAVQKPSLAIGDPLPPFPDLHAGRAAVVTGGISILRERLLGRAAVIGGIVGPFTLASQLLGTTTILMESVLHPEVVRPYIEFAVGVGVAYARAQVEAGADAICVEDMAASLDLVSPRIYQNLIHGAHRRLIAGIGAPVILHICGANTKILDLLLRTGAGALSLDAATDLAAAAGKDICAIVGGIRPVGVLLEGGFPDVRRAVSESLEAGVHILAPGCGLPPGTPTGNLLEMARAAREGTA
jgi:[methyl-Co(III) methanol-specific corrinoid protein]:coenzyme M methyltransferase